MLGRTKFSNLDSSQVWFSTIVRKIGGPVGSDRSTISQPSLHVAEWSHKGTLMVDLILNPSNSSPKSLARSLADSAASIISRLEMLLKIVAGVGIVVFGMRGVYVSWFPHTLNTFVYTNENWTDGDRRACTLTTRTRVYQLDCADTLSQEPPEILKVRYTGDDPSGHHTGLPQHWTCNREVEFISCDRYEQSHED